MPSGNPAWSRLRGRPLMRRGVPVLVGKCAGRMMWIYYEWADLGSSRDLDTKTTFLGYSCGWSVTPSSTGQAGVIRWPSGDNTQSGPEIVFIYAQRTLEQGMWSGQTNIECYAGWYIPAQGSGPARIRVVYNGNTQTKIISPGSQSGAANTHVASITLREDGSFTLT